MKPEDSGWQNLVSAARRLRDERETTAPYGFATRVAALAMDTARVPAISLFERFSWRALGVAALLALTSVATSYSAFSSSSSSSSDEDVISNESAVAALFGTS